MVGITALYLTVISQNPFQFISVQPLVTQLRCGQPAVQLLQGLFCQLHRVQRAGRIYLHRVALVASELENMPKRLFQHLKGATTIRILLPNRGQISNFLDSSRFFSGKRSA